MPRFARDVIDPVHPRFARFKQLPNWVQVIQFDALPVGARFRRDPNGCTYQKLGRRRYQLVNRNGELVRGMTYSSAEGDVGLVIDAVAIDVDVCLVPPRFGGT